MAFQKNISPLEVLAQTSKKGDWAPVYFLYGEEVFIKDRCLKTFRAGLMDEQSEEMNFRQFFFPESSVDSAANELETLPFFAPRKLLFFHDIENLKDKDWERLEPLLPKDADSLFVVLTAGKIDKRKKMFKQLFDRSISLEMKAPFENQIPGWVRSLANEKGKEIHGEAIGLLHRRVGSTLAELDMQISQLTDYVGDREEITADDVLAATSHSKTESVFELTDALGRHDNLRALELLGRLIEDGQSELGIIAMIARHLRILMLILEGQKGGLSGPQLAQHASVPPYFLRQYQDQARHWSSLQLKSHLLATAQTEKSLKQSTASPEILMDALFLDFSRQYSRQMARSALA